MFAWQPSRKGLLELPDIEVDPVDIPHAAAKFDLSLSLAETDGGVIGHLDYAAYGQRVAINGVRPRA
jgi:hypothetical protein